MSKHDVLTEEEMSTFVPTPSVLLHIEQYQRKMNLRKEDLRILDWGCGRGRSVAYLREQGFKAFGVDIDPEPISNGRQLFLERGLDVNNILTLIDQDGKTKFSDGFFHFVFSESVFEHIKDLESVAKELQKITSPGGVGLHLYPAHRYIKEGHLLMPFVHWLPKTKLRKMYIWLFLLLGQNPNWKELEGKSIREQAEVYYDYSINKTYYRNCYTVKKIFTRKGFDIDFVTIDHPKLKGHPVLYRLSTFKPLRVMMNWVLNNFFAVFLLTTRKSD